MKKGQPLYPSDAELVSSVENGDNKAYETLLQRYNREIFACLHFHLYDYDHEMDIYQDSCIKGLTKIRDHKYKEKPDKTFWPWFKTIIINIIIDEARRDRLFVHHQEYTVKSYSKNSARNDFEEDTAFRELVYDWTKDMNEPMRSIMRMSLLDGSLDEEIARELNISIGNVKVAISRAKKKAEKTLHLTALQKMQLGITESLKKNKKKKFQRL